MSLLIFIYVCHETIGGTTQSNTLIVCDKCVIYIMCIYCVKMTGILVCLIKFMCYCLSFGMFRLTVFITLQRCCCGYCCCCCWPICPKVIETERSISSAAINAVQISALSYINALERVCACLHSIFLVGCERKCDCTFKSKIRKN